ncbi:MAG: hypothetical protein HQ594_01330, partial [Candidatus Omnitrophica bacterium]|nr:hypothetical protein [Candidatus Omnitrophota bacterium]
MTTEELLQKCRKKDRTAWDEFAKRYRHLVAKSVGYKIKTLKTPSSRNEIADIIQDIFLAIWEKDKLDEVKDPATLESWLAIMSINMASNHFKKRSLRHFQDAVSIEKTLTIENRRTTLGEVLT